MAWGVFALALAPAALPAQDVPGANPPTDPETEVLLKSVEKTYGSPKKVEAGETFLAELEARASKAAAEASGDAEAYRKEELALRAFAGRALVLEEHQASEFKIVKRKVGKVAPPLARWPEAEFLAYAFGTRDLAAQQETAVKIAGQLTSGKATVDSKILPLRVRCRDLLHGAFAERELVVAGILRTLDVDRGHDRFARFLDSWKNAGPHGEETFYQALDRTAGTEDSVFFFDIMLADFTLRLGDVEGTKGLKVAHDHLHAAFLAYRQYRAFIEAVAHALTLPHDQAMPARLKRYDYISTKGLPAGSDYSLRHQIDILLENAGGDPGAVIAIVQEVLRAHPLPDPLWTSSADPMSHFGSAFAAREVSTTTEELKEARWKKSTASARAWRAVVREGLSGVKP